MTAPADGPTPLLRREPEEPTPPTAVPLPVPAEQPPAAAEVHSPIAASGDSCPSCGSTLAKDQRYCLVCGARRGDPRLPFMDAVVFMDAIRKPPGGEGSGSAPPTPPSKRPLMSANASLVAGVATLVLAIGVGVLIGRSGDSGTSTAGATPQIIRVGGSGGEGEAEEAAAGANEKGGKNAAGGGKARAAPTVKKAKEKTETGESGATKAVEEVFKPENGVKLAKPEQKVGEKCEKGAAGCNSNGTFDGSFFGE